MPTRTPPGPPLPLDETVCVEPITLPGPATTSIKDHVVSLVLETALRLVVGHRSTRSTMSPLHLTSVKPSSTLQDGKVASTTQEPLVLLLSLGFVTT